MRNLKRALSLVLAAMMLIGMMVVGASAADAKDFTDKGEIQNTEAVNTMVALNVISGKEDGSYFDPTGTLTRAEMAKIVSFVMNGGVEPNIGTKVVPTYSDIDGHWAEAYIEYCTSMGIINGDGAGKFNPEGTLTASQCAKMFLTAMGYNAEVFGFTGNSWETNTNRYANEAGLYDELSGLSVSAPISRDDACQMAYNAIQAAMMIRNWTQNVTDGSISEHYELALNPDGTPNRTLFSEKFGGKIFVGTFEGNYNTGDAAAKGEIEIFGRLDTESTGDRPAYLPSDLDLSNLGEQYKILFKDGKGGTDNEPDKNDTIYGIYNTEALTVYSITKADLQDAGDNAADGKIKFGDTLYKMAATVSFNSNYGAAKTTQATAAAAAVYVNTPANGLRVTSSDSIKLVCNTDGEIADVYVLNTKIAEVTAVTATNIQMTGEASKKVEDCVNTDGVVVGDIAHYADVYPTATRTTIFYEDAQKVEGVIEAYNNAAPTSVKIDGTWYKYNGHNSFSATAANYTVGALGIGNVGDTVSLILDGGSNYGAYKVITGFNNYALVTHAEAFLGTNSVKAMLADGTTSTYTNVEKADGGRDFGDIGTDLTANGATLYAYELRSDGTKIALNDNRANWAATTDSTTAGATKITHKYVADNMTLVPVNNGTDTVGTPLIVNADAVVYLNNGVKWQAYTASELNNFSFNDHSCLQYITKDSKVVALVGYVGSFPTANSKNSSFGYVTGYISTQVNDSPVTELTVWNGTESVTLLIDGTATASKGDFIRYPIVAEGAVISNSSIDLEGSESGYAYTAAKVKSYDTANGVLITTTDSINAAGSVVTGTDTSYKLTADTVVIGVKSADKAGSTVNVPVIYTQVYGKDFNNVIIVTEAKTGYREVKAIFVDEDNKMQEAIGGASYVAPVTLSGAATDASIKTSLDGIYVPSAASNLPAGVTGDVSNVKVFKFTASTAAGAEGAPTPSVTYTLTIKDTAGTVKYTESATFTNSTGGHYFYVDATATAGVAAANNVIGLGLTAGNVYSAQIVGSDGVTYLSANFVA